MYCASALPTLRPAGRAVRRTVQVGQRGAELAEVLDGLAEGEVVLLHPNDRITNGVRVTTEA